MKITLRIAGLAALLFTPGAFAAGHDDGGFYAGGSVGQSKIKDTCDEVSAAQAADLGITGVTGDEGKCEDTDIGWKIYGGLTLGDYLGLEIGYVLLGEALVENADLTLTTRGGDVVFDGDFGFEHDGSYFIAAMGRYPATDNISVFAKGGFHFWEVSGINEGTITVDGTPVRIIGDDDTDLFYGIGAQLMISDGLGIRTEWERFEFDGDIYEDKVDLLSVGAFYAF